MKPVFASLAPLVLGLLSLRCEGSGCGSRFCVPAAHMCPASQPAAVLEVADVCETHPAQCKATLTNFEVLAIHQLADSSKIDIVVGDFQKVVLPPNANHGTGKFLVTYADGTLTARATYHTEHVWFPYPVSPGVPKAKAIAAMQMAPDGCIAAMETSAELGVDCSPDDKCDR